MNPTSSRTLSQIAIAVFLAIGVMGITTRYYARLDEQAAREDSLWRLTYNAKFEAQGDETEVRLAIPASSDHVSIQSEDFDSQGLTLTTKRLRPSGTRELVVQTRQLGNYEVTAGVVLRLSPRGEGGLPKLANLSGDVQARYLRDERTTVPTRSPRVRALLERAESETTSEEALLQWVFDFCSRELGPAPPNFDSNPLGTLSNRKATPLGRSLLMVTLCRAAKMPARLVTGFELRQQNTAKTHVWVEVFRDSRWQPFDPEYGYARHMPINFVAVRRDGASVYRSPNSAKAEDLTCDYSITRLGPPEQVLKSDTPRPSQILDLTRLPVEMHEVISLLLLLQIGALVTSFLRNVIGMATFGTFAPVLFAVSFIYADWSTGLVILIAVVAAGLLSRSLVERLRLLMVPRLSIILTAIVLCVVFGISAMDYLTDTPSAKAVLLPLVILTILIERFYVTTEEDGPGFAIQLTIGTLVAAGICYAVLGWERVGQLILIYPETHLITIALFIAIGRYSGYRLVELWRFRDLAQEETNSL